jgi:hypothetical protein
MLRQRVPRAVGKARAIELHRRWRRRDDDRAVETDL